MRNIISKNVILANGKTCNIKHRLISRRTKMVPDINYYLAVHNDSNKIVVCERDNWLNESAIFKIENDKLVEINQ